MRGGRATRTAYRGDRHGRQDPDQAAHVASFEAKHSSNNSSNRCRNRNDHYRNRPPPSPILTPAVSEDHVGDTAVKGVVAPTLDGTAPENSYVAAGIHEQQGMANSQY